MRRHIMALAAVLCCTPALAQQPGSLLEQADGIEYHTPQAAVAALRDKPGVSMAVQDGWLMANDPSNHTVWSFPPSADPAYPAVVRRQMYVEGNQILIKMGVKCGGTKLACDGMVLKFERLNQQVRERMGHLPGTVAPTTP